MASKIKVDTLETADGSGSITLNNPIAGDGSGLTGVGKVLQVVSKSGSSIGRTTISTSGSWQSANDFNLAITPSSSSSKILVTFCIPVRVAGATTPLRGGLRLLRDTSSVWNTDGFGEHIHVRNADNEHDSLLTVVHLDSPNTTSAVNYNAQGKLLTGTLLILFEGTKGASITLMEVAG